MNYKIIIRIIGLIVLVESFFMLVPMFLCVCDGEEQVARSFLIPVLMALALGTVLLCYSRNAEKSFYAQESLAATGLSWMIMSVIGALPFYLSGQIPNYVDALFEIVSGFTTTGASILSDVESLSRGILYWRSFSHWLGGMGVLVLLLALIPASDKRSGYALNLLQAESPGPSVSKLTPSLRETALILYGIYILLTALCVVFLLLGGMPLFESLCISYGAAGTGGFSIKNASLGGYSGYIQTTTAVFMFLFGVNFSVHYLFLTGRLKSVLKNEELRLYTGVTFIAVMLIAFNIKGMFPGFSEAVHHSLFQVVSVLTTTGFSTVDFNLWPAFSKSVLLLLMCFGACAGSTGGGIKMSRVLLLYKGAKRNFKELLNPRKIEAIHANGQVVDEKVIHNVNAYLVLYCMICFFSIILIAMDGYTIGTNVSAVIACFNNIGPGFELVGAASNYSVFDPFSKVVLMIDMLLGRLEIFPILILFWKKTWGPPR